jgi:hypothetical protein
MQGFTDNAANVILAQRRGIKPMPEFGHHTVS